MLRSSVILTKQSTNFVMVILKEYRYLRIHILLDVYKRQDRTRETHTTGAVVSTVADGDNLTLSSGRDISSQAAKIVAENNITLQAGRDVNLLAEASTEDNSNISGD